MPDDKLLCLRGVITRKTENGTGVRLFSKLLPIVPPELQV
jgi:hypothetical protein